MADQTFFEFGRFCLDPTGRFLFRNDQEIPLPPKAAHVLLLLVQKAGSVVEREEILKTVWPETFVEEGSLARAISTLRKALEDGENRREYIATVSKRGYRFTVPVTEVRGRSPQQDPAVQPAADLNARPVVVHPRKGVIIGAAGVALILGFTLAALRIGAVRFRLFGTAPSTHINSIAVLPLKNLSDDREQDYFADGMTEALITDLGKVSALRVISRTSVLRYKDTKKPLPEIARELHADALVEGTVARSVDRVRITANLVQATPERHLWAESYDRDLRDVIALQNDVARTIAQQIQVELTPEEHARLSSSHAAHLVSAYSINTRAYEDYLRGRFSLERGELRKSIAYFERAIQEEPNYAPGYAGLANSYICLGQPWFSEGDMRPGEVYPQAKAAAKRALEIDDSLGQAHLALGRVIQLYDWDWAAVEKEYRRALELNQNDALARIFFVEYLQEMGRNEEALVESRRAVALDPLNAAEWSIVGFVFYTAREYDKAMPELRKALELEPDRVDTHVGLGWVLEQKKMYAAAIAELEKAVGLSRRHEVPLASLGKVLGESGRKREATKILEELKLRAGNRYISPCLFALVQIGLGERDQAIASLEQGYTNRDQWMLYLKVDPHMDDLRSEPRFKDLLRRVGIPQ